MSNLMIFLTASSLLGLFAISVYRYIKYRAAGNFILQLIAICFFAGLLYFFFWSHQPPTPKGDGIKDIVFALVLYFFMLLGMAAQYLFSLFEKPKGKRLAEFDWGLFVAPVFASPIVFLPLLAALQNVDIELDKVTLPRLMVFLVAFENGFFWKEYFDNRREAKKEGPDEE